MTESLKNATGKPLEWNFHLSEEDLVVEDTQFKASNDTVLDTILSHKYDTLWRRPYTPGKKGSYGIWQQEAHYNPYPKA